MALTKVNRGGLNTGISDSSNATFLTVDSSEQAVIKSEDGAVTTSVQQGLAKSWVNFNGTGTIAARDSFNLSSLTDVATGKYGVVMANAMNSILYCPTVYSNSTAGDSFYGGGRAGVKNTEFVTDSTTAYEVVSYSNDYIDATRNYTHVFGDLA